MPPRGLFSHVPTEVSILVGQRLRFGFEPGICDVLLNPDVVPIPRSSAFPGREEVLVSEVYCVPPHGVLCLTLWASGVPIYINGSLCSSLRPAHAVQLPTDGGSVCIRFGNGEGTTYCLTKLLQAVGKEGGDGRRSPLTHTYMDPFLSGKKLPAFAWRLMKDGNGETALIFSNNDEADPVIIG